MMIQLIVLSLFLALCQGKTPLSLQFDHQALSQTQLNTTVTGDALFISPLLEEGKIKEALTRSHIWGFDKSLHMHSGYITVNRVFNSNLFFWFINAEVQSATAPVVVWLQGGPGASSMFGKFTEHGPFYVSKTLKAHKRQYSWTHNFNMLYIDQPAGTGFSFTDYDAGYVSNQSEVADDLYSFLQQFFTLFPDLRKNDFYVTGESYGGKYVPAISYKIHKENQIQSSKKKINLKGMAIGNGLSDPLSMLNYGDLLYQIGLIGDSTREEFYSYERSVRQLIKEEKYEQAFKEWDLMLNGDMSEYPSLFLNATGFTNYFNFIHHSPCNDMEYFSKYLNLEVTRKAIHVGNRPFNGGDIVEHHLKTDMIRSVKPWVEELLDADYKVLFYNGQLDIIVAYPLTESFLSSLSWKHQEMYKKSLRSIWRVDDDLAGYVVECGNLTQLVVRNAGHMVPHDQPQWAYHMIHKFINNESFK